MKPIYFIAQSLNHYFNILIFKDTFIYDYINIHGICIHKNLQETMCVLTKYDLRERLVLDLNSKLNRKLFYSKRFKGIIGIGFKVFYK